MATETILIQKESNSNKKVMGLSNDIVLQLEASLKDIKAGRVKRVR